MRIALVPMLGFAAVALIAVPANAADVKGEIATAADHAGYAAAASDIAAVHMHLHHVVNCIVGPGGTEFDSKEINPCAGRGNGAMPDATDAATKKSLQAVVTEAEKGIAETEIAAAKKDATTAQSMLKAIK
jgi:hypothetical protein